MPFFDKLKALSLSKGLLNPDLKSGFDAVERIKPSEAKSLIHGNFDNMIDFHIFPGIFLCQLIK